MVRRKSCSGVTKGGEVGALDDGRRKLGVRIRGDDVEFCVVELRLTHTGLH
jgi:hypothetical protein